MEHAEVLSLGKAEYEAAEAVQKHAMNPSNALHVAAMILNKITRTATEDTQFRRVSGIETVWMEDAGAPKKR
ncbi:MAG: hypothetical protein QFX35_05855 [Candidatus Verstraetearchaeota archaeon]|nr:hypothetical protein [Candidatus Verstraetearchaeota archaeon]